jgi:hypothetical protein
VTLARETGASALLNSNDFGKGLARVYQDTSVYYSIGVTSPSLPRIPEGQRGGEPPGTIVRTRRGYAARTDAERLGIAVQATLRPTSPTPSPADASGRGAHEEGKPIRPSDPGHDTGVGAHFRAGRQCAPRVRRGVHRRDRRFRPDERRRRRRRRSHCQRDRTRPRRPWSIPRPSRPQGQPPNRREHPGQGFGPHGGRRKPISGSSRLGSRCRRPVPRFTAVLAVLLAASGFRSGAGGAHVPEESRSGSWTWTSSSRTGAAVPSRI